MFLRWGSHLPPTSQPSLGDFLEVYEKLAQCVESIISFYISGGVSGMLQSVRAAA